MAIKSAPTTRIALRRILYLTDFSLPSEAALPFVVSIARHYGAVVNALHILTPAALAYATPELGDAALAAGKELAQTEMQKVDSQLLGVPHEVGVEWSASVWPVVERIIDEAHSDLIVVGTHGRTGVQKLLLGSVAEEVFRKSSIPVLTIGPAVSGGTHKDGRFRNILLATDFGSESQAAAGYAVSFAQENQARLTLLHVLRGPRRLNGDLQPASVAEIFHSLSEIVPSEAELWAAPNRWLNTGSQPERSFKPQNLAVRI